MRLGFCKCALSSRKPALAREADVLVVAYGVLRQAVESSALLVSEFLCPFTHARQHFALDFRVGVMEVGVEPEFIGCI